MHPSPILVTLALSTAVASCDRSTTETITLDQPPKVITIAPEPTPKSSAPIVTIPADLPKSEDDVRCEAPLERKVYKSPFGSTVFCQKPNGPQHGPFASFDRAGRLATYGQKRDGQDDGIWVMFGPDGTTTLAEYVDGEPTRKSTMK